MGKQITVYYDSDGPDLKAQVAKLRQRRELPYYRRSMSAIAAMLLQERLEEILGGEEGGPRDPE